MTNGSLVFEQLHNAGFVAAGKPNVDAIRRSSLETIVDFAEQAAVHTSTTNLTRETSPYTHSATLSLSGGRQPCSAMPCRTAHIEELGRFAALYSDRVYIRNPFMDYLIHPTHLKKDNESSLRLRFLADVRVLLRVRSLVEAGKVVPVTPPGNRCPHCLWTKDIASDERAELIPELHRLEEEYRTRTWATLRKAPHHYDIRVNAPADLMPHAVWFKRRELPPGLLADGSLLRRLESGSAVRLNREMRGHLKIPERYANEVFTNIIFELLLSRALGTSFLTERELHLDVLASIAGTDDLAARNYIAEKHLTAIVPFAGDISLEDLTKLRQREDEAFVLFRTALNEAIDEARGPKKDFSERDARQLYADVLAPAIAQMDRRVEVAKKGLRRSALATAASWAGAISFGLYAGILPGGFAALAGALGLTSLVQQMTASAIEKTNVTGDIATDPLFFLWRVKQLSRKAMKRR